MKRAYRPWLKYKYRTSVLLNILYNNHCIIGFVIG